MRAFSSKTGVVVKVGEGAKDNDILTMAASPDYYWFHVSGYPGAHVVAETKELDRETKRDAAALAAHFSQFPRNEKFAMVEFTRVADVERDPKVHGLVHLRAHETLTVFHNKIPEKARIARLLTNVTEREYLLT